MNEVELRVRPTQAQHPAYLPDKIYEQLCAYVRTKTAEVVDAFEAHPADISKMLAYTDRLLDKCEARDFDGVRRQLASTGDGEVIAITLSLSIVACRAVELLNHRFRTRSSSES